MLGSAPGTAGNILKRFRSQDDCAHIGIVQTGGDRRVHPRRVFPTCQYCESPHLICPFSGLVAQLIRGDAPRGIAACDLPLKTKAPDMFLHAGGVLIGVGPVEIGKGDLRRT
jgi:hypothetical protein